jgi:hypothetical protein
MMTMLKELAAELIGMFCAEKRLAITVVAIVAAAGSLVDFAGLNPLVGGAVLLFGCLILLIESVCRAARGERFLDRLDDARQRCIAP